MVLPYHYRYAVAVKCKRLAKKDFQVVFRKGATLGGMFARTFKTNNRLQVGLLYQIFCHWGVCYIGETGRHLNVRIPEHQPAIKNNLMSNGIARHTLVCKSGIDWNNVTILCYENVMEKPKVKEALMIRKYRPVMNLNEGLELKLV